MNRKKKWKADKEKAWRESPEAPDKEMEEAEKNFGIKEEEKMNKDYTDKDLEASLKKGFC